MSSPESTTAAADAGPGTTYGQTEQVFVHFEDLDSMGMLHNVRYGLLVERALTMFWDRHGYTFRGGGTGHPDANVGVAEFSVSYRRPILGTGPASVHLFVEALGTSSVTYGFRVLSGEGRLHAEGKRVQVRLDPETHRPVPWADETRAIYDTLRKP